MIRYLDFPQSNRHEPSAALAASQLDFDSSIRSLAEACDDNATPLTQREAYVLSLALEVVAALGDRPSPPRPVEPGGKFFFGDVTIDTRRREVTNRGSFVHLTPKEYEVLLLLARADRLPVSREDLRREVWSNTISAESRAIDQVILELRRKLEDNPRNPRYLRCAWRLGYRLEGNWAESAKPGSGGSD